MNKDIALALIAILAVGLLTFGVQATITQPPMQPSKPFAAGEKTAAVAVAEAKDDSPVVMRVNGAPVTEADFVRFIEQLPEQQRPMAASPEGRKIISEELVKQKVLEVKGREMGLDRDPDVQRQLGAIQGQMVAIKALEKLVTPTEAELRAEYEKLIDLSHILIAYHEGQIPPRSGQPIPVEQAMQKAAAIVARLRGGADFAQAAQAVSDDPQSAQQGGRLGTVSPNDLGPEMGPVVAKLKEGEISDPQRSRFGIHIFRVGKRSAAGFNEVRPMLEQRMKQERVQATLARETATAKVERDPKYFGAPIIPSTPRPQGGKSSS